MRAKEDHSRERNLRCGQTDAEAKLWRHLRDRRLGGFKFRRQHRIGPFIVDLVCADAKLVIEVDGGQHADDAERDAARSAVLNAAGYTVVRFWNHDVLGRTEQVLNEILAVLRSEVSKG